MKSLSISPLQDHQHDAAARLLCDAFNIPASANKQELTEMHGGLTQVFAAARDGQLIGLVRCHKFDSHLSVSLLAVDKTEQRQGIGQHLMRHAEEFMQSHWMDGKETYISREDKPRRENSASRFYERLGDQEWA